MDPQLQALTSFGISLAIGALIGIERQRAQASDPTNALGGIRTFPLMALYGCAASYLGRELGVAAFVALTACFATLLVASYVVTSVKGEAGTTTEMAALLTFALGAMVERDHALLASSLAVAITGLLSLRKPLHELAQKIEEDDLYAALKLLVLSLVILPVLPNHSYGPEPYALFNPFKIWLLVVFIGGIGFLGYVGIKLLGPGRGITVAGALGGVVSSTAVTLSFSGRSRESPDLSPAFALGIAVAWATMFGRVFLEVAVVCRSLLPSLAPPLGAAMVAGVLGAALLYWRSKTSQPTSTVPHRNPFSLSSAFKFGVLFTVILFVAKFAQEQFKGPGVLVAAALTGMVDVDAMTLSMANLASKGEVSTSVATRAICLTVASNTVTKALLAASLGAPALRRALLPVVVATLVAGGAVLLFVGR